MTLRVGILGAGGVAGRHAAAMRELPELMQLVAACGRDRERTEAFAAQFGGTAYTEFERMLDDQNLDLLVVCLPPYAHGGEVETAARRGVNLLVEKPIALHLDRARSMVEASRNVVASCGFMYRHGAAIRRWDEHVAAGQTGRPAQFSGFYQANALHAPWWRDKQKSGGQMVEQLIHITDLMRHWLGMPETVYARTANLFHVSVPGYSAEDVSAMIFGYADGRMGVLRANNVAIPNRWEKGWTIVAETMTGEFADWNTAELVRTGPKVSVESVSGGECPFVAQLRDVAEAVRDKRPPRVPLADGEASLRIALMAQRSAEERRELSL